KGGLDVSTYQRFLKGGISFPGFVPGKPDDSFSVMVLEGKTKLAMPPKKAQQPTAEERKLLRAWIAAGAKDDSGTATAVKLPDIKSKIAAAPPVAALAYRPDGKLLAAGVYKEVVLIDPGTGAEVGRLDGQTDGVTALAFSRDGQRLAVASGSSG